MHASHISDHSRAKRSQAPWIAKHHQERGFSLVEMAMVMAILSLVIGGGVATYSSMREKQQRQKTDISLERVRESLTWYAVTNGRLPCPDVGVDASNVTQTSYDGAGDTDGAGNCRLAYGVLPWNDLGLQPFDHWGNYFSYHVAPDYSQQTIGCLTTGTITVRKDTDTGMDLGSDLAAVVVSHGKNGAGRIMPAPLGSPDYLTRAAINGSDPNTAANQSNNEAENADIDTADAEAHDDANPLYVQGAGDDLLVYLSPLLLKTKLMEAGRDMTACAPTTSVSTSTTSVPTTTTSVSTSTTSVPTTTTSVSTSTTSVPTTTTSVSTSTTSVSTSTSSVSTSTSSVSTSTSSVSTSTTSVSTTTTSVPTTTTSTVATTSTTTVSIPAQLPTSCWNRVGVTISGSSLVFPDDTTANIQYNSTDPNCPLQNSTPTTALCYTAALTVIGDPNENCLEFKIVGQDIFGAPINVSYGLDGDECTLSSTYEGNTGLISSIRLNGGKYYYNASAKTIQVYMGQLDTSTLAVGGLTINGWIKDDVGDIKINSHSINSCSIGTTF